MRALLSVATLREADGWVQALLALSERWDSFLAETTMGKDSRVTLTHERLLKARRSLVRLVNAGTLFTHLDPGLIRDGPLPSTNNRIEGGVNAQLGSMLRDHREGCRSRGVSRQYSGGATLTARTRCPPPRSCA